MSASSLVLTVDSITGMCVLCEGLTGIKEACACQVAAQGLVLLAAL